MLWLALHLPLLPLESLSRGMSADQALAVEDSHHRLLIINAEAEMSGIRPGMRINTALALDPGLRCLPRQREQEQQALLGLANWSLQFTSMISIEEPDGLLLEIGASLSLFGGLDPLLCKVEQGIHKLGYSLHCAVAPTPLGAWLPARIGVHSRVLETAELRPALVKLPLHCLPLEEKLLERLAGMGLRSLGDLLKLPRGGLAKRSSPELTLILDRALGRQADPRPTHEPQAHFHRHLDLVQESQGGKLLLHAAEQLLLELGGFLQGQDAATTSIDFGFLHLQHPTTALNLAFLSPGRDPQHMLGLLGIRLDQLRLPAPVVAIELDCIDVVRFENRETDLFAQHSSGQQSFLQLLERLRNRLGDTAIGGLQLHQDHRPEQAWSIRNPGKTAPDYSATPPLQRPLWLLNQALPIRVQSAHMQLQAGPERIETGWWDGQDMERDYFVITTDRGRRLWVYREGGKQGDWFLHGLFA